jgi:hypothetical protein
MKELLAIVYIGNEWILRNGQPIGTATQFRTPGALITIILKNVFMLAGVLLLVMIILGGVSYISGAGNNDPKKTAAAKQTMTNAIIGFLIIFTSYWIIKIIETITGLKIISP